MKRQILVRGAAIAFAGVAASVFAAQQFMGLDPQTAQMTSPGASDQVRSASLMGGTAPTSATAQSDLAAGSTGSQTAMLNLTPDSAVQPAPGMDAVQSDQMAALSTQRDPAPDATQSTDFQPPLTLAQARRPADSSCLPNVTAAAAIDALVDLRVTAPCAPNARLVISHGDLAFSAYTDDAGSFSTYLPALSTTANIETFLPDQSVLQVQAVVPDASQHMRVIVQWTGSDGVMTLHAFHRNAGYGEAGHIHASRPFDPQMDGAFILSLGEARGPEPMLSQIYSVPTALSDQTRLELEVAVTAQTCGRDVTAYVAKSGGGGSGRLEEMVLSMPECGSVGDMVIVPLSLAGAMQASLTPDAAMTPVPN